MAGLSVPQLEKLRAQNPVLAEALQKIIDHINANVKVTKTK